MSAFVQTLCLLQSVRLTKGQHIKSRLKQGSPSCTACQPANMSYQNRQFPSTLRHPSIGGAQSTTSQSPVLQARINEKKAELENLKQLRDLSGGLAAQMQALEEKLSTLSNGTEGWWLIVRCYDYVILMLLRMAAVATVLSNWHNVMRAINMASIKVPKPTQDQAEAIDPEPPTPLPQTLVRIPIEDQKPQ